MGLGYTISDAQGRGTHGWRASQWTHSGNIRLQIVCDMAAAEWLMALSVSPRWACAAIGLRLARRRRTGCWLSKHSTSAACLLADARHPFQLHGLLRHGAADFLVHRHDRACDVDPADSRGSDPHAREHEQAAARTTSTNTHELARRSRLASAPAASIADSAPRSRLCFR